ncbi:MAG: sigma-70 family RNA polymerase sigma factor [Fimbriimonadaceae bacterium]|nr:sigma-70 family RNA polymerase sigma factor [Fimbriimonadaceae bacterium]
MQSELESLAQRVLDCRGRQSAALATGATVTAADWGVAAGEVFVQLWEVLEERPTRYIVSGYRRAMEARGRCLPDLLAELRLHLFERLDRWRPQQGGFERWWARVANNYLRSQLDGRATAAEPLDECREPADPGEDTAAAALRRWEDEQLGDVWERYAACVRLLLADASDPARIRRCLLAFAWVDLAGLENQQAAAALGIPPYQCTRDRARARRELAAAFARLFPALAEPYQPPRST